MAGAIDGLKMLASAGFALAIVTNQSGIVREYYTVQDAVALHDNVLMRLGTAGVTIHAVTICPHGPEDNCRCRKPQTGMVGQVERSLVETVDRDASWTIGDKVSDMQFGRTLRTRTVLPTSRHWTPDNLDDAPDMIADSLYEAAVRIVREPLTQATR